MKLVAPLALLLNSQAAVACAMGGPGMGGPGMGAGAHGGGLVAGALMAGVAALGWWLLTRAHKETERALLWSGRVVGWVLLAGGLAGFLCAGLSPAARAMRACSSCSMQGSQSGGGGGGGGGELPPGHP